ncbi:hypothetical protein LCGC14_1147480 [marine sediment metagenome]|uniref:Uncharacterized protein n=1 Tax=marine sediment metagenome TaxID=412755 RepID=A0A0F9MJS2_9ZZZZ|nr:hypothetical protein [Phycisphaerae bacterium]HDZ44729.1 hypothetical protein [Phycisphaerae bacterium]
MNEQAGGREAATERLAQIHYQSDDCIAVYAVEAADLNICCQLTSEGTVVPGKPEPIRLLEVNQDTPAQGFVPLGFLPMPRQGIEYKSHVAEVTPEEFEQIVTGELKLPKGWERRRFIRRETQGDPSSFKVASTAEEERLDRDLLDCLRHANAERLDAALHEKQVKPADPPREKTPCETWMSPAECEQFLSRMAGTPMADHKAVRTVRKILHAAQQLPHDLDVPQPNGLRGEGGIKIEWIIGRTRVELELWPDGDTHLHVEDDYEVVGTETLTLGWNTRQETAWLR